MSQAPQPPKPAPQPQPSPQKTPAAKTPVDPQEAKLEAFKRPEVNLNPDGPTIADEQRARAAEVERKGQKKYQDEIDERSPEERTNKQVPGVTPPTKRD
jgi:hypothetical protein